MGKKYKILIIDDSKDTVAGVKNFLDGKYQTATACNGLDGLKTIEKDRGGIDLVITDLVMPVMSGVTLIGVLKKKYPATPVIAMTGWGHHPKALATEAKADLILDKPFEMEVLDQSISSLLAKRV
jgi:DNA-binding NtrC family response regulator